MDRKMEYAMYVEKVELQKRIFECEGSNVYQFTPEKYRELIKPDVDVDVEKMYERRP